LSGLFGVDSNLLARGLGFPAELLNARANASRNSGGFFSSLGSLLGARSGHCPAHSSDERCIGGRSVVAPHSVITWLDRKLAFVLQIICSGCCLLREYRWFVGVALR